MQSIYLKFYLTEKQQRDGKLLHEWLLEKARAQGVPGGSVFRAIAGYGRNGKLHEESFIELAGELPVQVEFLLEEKMADDLLEELRGCELNIRYVRFPVSLGIV